MKVFLCILLLVIGGCEERKDGKPTPPEYEYRCDHAKVADFSLKCVENHKAYAGDSDGSAVDCVNAAERLFCESISDGNARDGRKWVYENGQWHL